MDNDRAVHLTIVPHDGARIEIVRYNRAGKWYVESGGKRRHITLAEAVSYYSNRPAVIWHKGRPGGQAFDAKVMKVAS